MGPGVHVRLGRPRTKYSAPIFCHKNVAGQTRRFSLVFHLGLPVRQRRDPHARFIQGQGLSGGRSEEPTPWNVRIDDVAQRCRGRRRTPWVQAFTSVSDGQVLKTRHGNLPQKTLRDRRAGSPSNFTSGSLILYGIGGTRMSCHPGARALWGSKAPHCGKRPCRGRPLCGIGRTPLPRHRAQVLPSFL